MNKLQIFLETDWWDCCWLEMKTKCLTKSEISFCFGERNCLQRRLSRPLGVKVTWGEERIQLWFCHQLYRVLEFCTFYRQACNHKTTNFNHSDNILLFYRNSSLSSMVLCEEANPRPPVSLYMRIGWKSNRTSCSQWSGQDTASKWAGVAGVFWSSTTIMPAIPLWTCSRESLSYYEEGAIPHRSLFCNLIYVVLRSNWPLDI